MHLLLALIVVGIVFSIISAIFYFVNSYRSVRYVQQKSEIGHLPSEVTIVVPVYNEDPELFDKVIQKVSLQKAGFVVVGDGCFQPYKEITERYGGKFVLSPQRGGKRQAMHLSMHYVDTPFVMFLDSDTLIHEDTLKELLSSFTEDVGGVGANLKILNDRRIISYASEFVERSREVILRAMNKSGYVMILDGGCSIYRTSIVKPFILSREFYDYKVLGRKSVAGDDRQLTSYTIKSGYRAVKNYGADVESPAQKTFKSYFRQQVRWSRNGWYYFFKDMFGGTARKAGAFYTFEMIYVYMLPLMFLGLTLTEGYVFLFAHHFDGSADLLRLIGYYTAAFFSFQFIRIARLTTTLANFMAILVFGLAISNNMTRDRLKTFIYGAFGLTIMFICSIYGLLTFWKQGSWLTR